MNWSQVVPILIGAVLAVVSTSATRFVTDWYENRTKRAHLNRFLATELSSCVSRIKGLLSIYGESEIPDPTFLAALERATSLFAARREAVYLLEIGLGQQILEFYDNVDSAVDMIMSMLRLAEKAGHGKFVSKEVQKQMANLDRALSLGSELLTHFELRGLTSGQAPRTQD
jgi:hypothetical protein